MSQTATYEMIGQFLLIASFFNNYLKKERKNQHKHPDPYQPVNILQNVTHSQIHNMSSICCRVTHTAISTTASLYVEDFHTQPDP